MPLASVFFVLEVLLHLNAICVYPSPLWLWCQFLFLIHHILLPPRHPDSLLDPVHHFNCSAYPNKYILCCTKCVFSPLCLTLAFNNCLFLHVFFRRQRRRRKARWGSPRWISSPPAASRPTQTRRERSVFGSHPTAPSLFHLLQLQTSLHLFPFPFTPRKSALMVVAHHPDWQSHPMLTHS